MKSLTPRAGRGKLGRPAAPISAGSTKTPPQASSCPDPESANSAKTPPALIGERDDWTDFLTIPDVARRGGVTVNMVPRLVAKELADNAADAAESLGFGMLPGGGFYVEDSGQGIAGDDDTLARLFSVRRGYRSSKFTRDMSRGRLGNGLRVVVGAALAGGGGLTVRTRGRMLVLKPLDDGTTKIVHREPWEGQGTRVEVHLNTDAAADPDDDVFAWARCVELLAGRRTPYKGRPSPWHFTDDEFWQLLQAHHERNVRDVVTQLEGCSKVGEEVGDFHRRKAGELNRDEAADLRRQLRRLSDPIKPKRLHPVGKLPDYFGHKWERGEFTTKANGEVQTRVPFVIDVWANVAEEPSVTVCVNRTPVTASVDVYRDQDKEYVISGCALRHGFKANQKRDFAFLVNVQCPALPLMSDGKTPDLEPVLSELLDALEAAARRAAAECRRREQGGNLPGQKDVIVDALAAAIKRLRGGRGSRYSLRQLFYAIRPEFLRVFGKEPLYGTFGKIIAGHEAEHGRLPGIYRDCRGVLYHPHNGQSMPLGTLTVEKYGRPSWLFDKVLYVEKEGLFVNLIDAQWPERFDCALLTSKGFATEAVMDLLALLGKTPEPVMVFCQHDSDGDGTVIYEDMKTAAERVGVEVVNLGLDPWDVDDLGLEWEPVERKKKKNGKPKVVRVAQYVIDKSPHWQDVLQKRRAELNAMTPEEYEAWTTDKMMPYHLAKLVPPNDVLLENTRAARAERIGDEVRAHVAQLLNIDAMVESVVGGVGAAVEVGDVPELMGEWSKELTPEWWLDRVCGLVGGRVEGIMEQIHGRIRDLLRQRLADLAEADAT